MEAGVYVSGVTAGGAADKAGLKNGDMLLSADGAAIDSVAALKEIIEDNAPGNVLEIVFQRNGAEQTTALTLGEAA
jgi:S1-C subfamily serine protease